MGTKNNLRYFTGACFCACALLCILELFFVYGFFYIWPIVHAIGYILLAISFFISLRALSIVGSGLLTIYALCQFLEYFSYWKLGYIPLIFLLVEFLPIILWFLLIAASAKTKCSKQIGVLASIIATVELILGTFSSVFGVYSILICLVCVVGCILLSFTYGNPQDTASAATSGSIPTVNSTELRIERLLSLKELLDKDVITQEEYELKKKQILES